MDIYRCKNPHFPKWAILILADSPEEALERAARGISGYYVRTQSGWTAELQENSEERFIPMSEGFVYDEQRSLDPDTWEKVRP